MNSAPAELLYALLFVGVLLVQYLMKRFGKPPRPDDALQEVTVPVAQPAELDVSIPESRGSAPHVPVTSLAAVCRAARLEAPAGTAAVSQRRAAPRSPLTGRSLQLAVVSMTLLGPCRAQAPHDGL